MYEIKIQFNSIFIVHISLKPESCFHLIHNIFLLLFCCRNDIYDHIMLYCIKNSNIPNHKIKPWYGLTSVSSEWTDRQTHKQKCKDPSSCLTISRSGIGLSEIVLMSVKQGAVYSANMRVSISSRSGRRMCWAYLRLDWGLLGRWGNV